MVLGIGLGIDLGRGPRITNARRTVLARVSGLVDIQLESFMTLVDYVTCILAVGPSHRSCLSFNLAKMISTMNFRYTRQECQECMAILSSQ